MVDDMNLRHSCTVSGIAPDLLKRLLAYDWPGNARELRNTIERATILAGSGLIQIEHLPPNFGEPGYATRLAPTPEEHSTPSQHDDSRTIHVEVGTTVDEAERQLIIKTLLSTHNNKTRAAEILGITPKTLQNKLKEYSSAAASADAETTAIDMPAVAAE
jgi:DNA-binding NtrC family response regulator